MHEINWRNVNKEYKSLSARSQINCRLKWKNAAQLCVFCTTSICLCMYSHGIHVWCANIVVRNQLQLFILHNEMCQPTGLSSNNSKICTQKASCADTDLVVDSNRTEPCIDIMNVKRHADLRHTTNIFTRWRYHYKLHGINIHLPIYSMSCGSNTNVHVLLSLLMLLLQPLHGSYTARPVRKTGVEIEKSSSFADTNLHWQRMNFKQWVRVPCTLFASHLFSIGCVPELSSIHECTDFHICYIVCQCIRSAFISITG